MKNLYKYIYEYYNYYDAIEYYRIDNRLCFYHAVPDISDIIWDVDKIISDKFFKEFKDSKLQNIYINNL